MMLRVWKAAGVAALVMLTGPAACSVEGLRFPEVRTDRDTGGGDQDGGRDRSRDDGPAAERVPGPLLGESRAGFLRFSWPRYRDWHSDLKSSVADRDTSKWRWRVLLSETGEFAGEEREFLVPSVSDSRHYAAFPEGGGIWTPDPDPVEECHVFGVADGVRLHARVGLVHLGSGGEIDRYGPLSAPATARMDVSREPAGLRGRGARVPQPDLDGTYLLFESLVGGSLNTGDMAVAYSGVDFENYAEGDSWWRGMRRGMDALLRGPAQPYAASNGVGFLFRAPNGDHRAWSDASADPKRSVVFWLLQGGRLPQPQKRWSVVGGGASPGMLDAWQSFDHAAGLPAGQARNRVMSLTQDLDQLSGITQPIVMYQSLYAAAHKIVWDEDVLRAFGLHVLLGRGFIPALDVLCTSARWDAERAGRVETPEYRVARALEDEAVVGRFFGETLLSGESRFAAGIGDAFEKLGDIQAFDLYVQDSGSGGYSAARARAPRSARVDVSEYLRAGRRDVGLMGEEFRMILRVNAGTCEYVRAGEGPAERCSRALVVAKDLAHTWGRRVLPCVMNQAFWRHFDAGELRDFMVSAGWRP